MNIELVRMFIAVAENLSFTRAAEKLGTTQPLLSRSIRRLEDLIGQELFHRSKRRITLTPSGAAFLEEAQGIIDRSSLAVRRAQMAGKGAPGTLRVGYMASMWMQTFHRGIRKFRGLYPEGTLELRMMQPNDQANALRRGEIDIGLMNFDHSNGQGLVWHTIARERYILAIPSDWPHRPSQPIDLATLRDRPFILADPELAPEIHAAHVACCKRAGFQPHIAAYNRDSAELRFLIASGLGAGFAYESALLMHVDGIHFAPMTASHGTFFSDSHMGWVPRDLPASMRDFISCMDSETYIAEAKPIDGSFTLEWQRTIFDGSGNIADPLLGAEQMRTDN